MQKLKNWKVTLKKDKQHIIAIKNQISFFISNNFNHYSCSEISQGVKKVMIELRFVNGIKKVTFDSEYRSGSKNW